MFWVDCGLNLPGNIVMYRESQKTKQNKQNKNKQTNTHTNKQTKNKNKQKTIKTVIILKG